MSNELMPAAIQRAPAFSLPGGSSLVMGRFRVGRPDAIQLNRFEAVSLDFQSLSERVELASLVSNHVVELLGQMF
jgi:hypothetical protein